MTDEPTADRSGWLTFSSADELLAWLEEHDDGPPPPACERCPVYSGKAS